MLPETDSAGAHQVAEALRQAIAQQQVVANEAGDPIRFTVSIGVAMLSVAGQTFELLLHNADKALYQAKQTGRNRVHTVGSADPNVLQAQ